MSVNEKMTALADIIREKSGASGKLSIDAMTAAVSGIKTGTPLETCTVTFDFPYAVGCDHDLCYTKVVDGDTVLVNETEIFESRHTLKNVLLGSIVRIRANGGYDGYKITPNITGSVTVLENVVDADGWLCLTFLVEGDCTILEGDFTLSQLTITENGTHNVTNYAKVIVNVDQGTVETWVFTMEDGSTVEKQVVVT